MSEKPITTNSRGEVLLDTPQVLSALGSIADIVLLGDSWHACPEIKQHIFSMLPELKKAGYRKMWLEMDGKNQAALDAALGADPTIESILPAVSAKDNKELFAEGILKAHQLGLTVGYIDDKAKITAFRESHPLFTEISDAVKAGRLEGKTNEQAENQTLAAFTADQKTQYAAEKLQWKAIRDGNDQGFADKILQSRDTHPKQMAVIGDGHFNRLTDVDEMLMREGCRVATVHVYKDLGKFGEYLQEYIHTQPEDGHARQLPALIYITDNGKFYQPENAQLQAEALKRHELATRGDIGGYCALVAASRQPGAQAQSYSL